MQSSSKRNPCPICGRTKDGDCRWTADLILCHRGSSHAPPKHLNVGDVIQVQSKPWALVRSDGGFDMAAAVFRPHRPRRHSHQKRLSNYRSANLLKARVRCAKRIAQQFLDLAEEANSVGEFELLPYPDLQAAFALIYQADEQGAKVVQALMALRRSASDINPDLEQVKAAQRQVRYQRMDVDRFRRTYLGEVMS